MLTNLIRLIKFLILLFFWLVFPPVFYWLAKRWYPHRKDWRRIFFAISPLMVILIFYVLMYTSIFTTDALKGSKWMIEKTNNYGVRDRSWRVDAAGNYSFSYLREQPEEYLRITINPGTYEMEVDFGTW